ncbi:MAG: cupredoxin domain-containing protein [Patescibacteria group bacterium]
MEPTQTTQSSMQPPMESPKSKKVYYIIAGFIVLIGLFFFLNSAPKGGTTEDAMVPAMQVAEYTVTYSDAGFNPATLEVTAGSKVRFVNNSNTDMWVASAMHPTHKELPGFDEFEGEPKGSVYEYTFTTAGQWRYHDHLKPEFRGSVTLK